MRYYTFTDNENVVYIGDHETMSEAMDNEASGAVWTFAESNLLALAAEIVAIVHQTNENVMAK